MKAFRLSSPYGEGAMIHSGPPLPERLPVERTARAAAASGDTAGKSGSGKALAATGEAAAGTVAAPSAQAAGTVLRAPRSALAGSLTLLPTGLLGLEAAVDTLQDLARLRAWADAQEAAVVERITLVAHTETYQPSTGTSPLAETVARTEIAAALTIPERTAQALMSEADLLVNTFPATHAALEAGTISRRHALTITDQAADLPAAHRAGFEADLLEQAPHLTCEKLKTAPAGCANATTPTPSKPATARPPRTGGSNCARTRTPCAGSTPTCPPTPPWPSTTASPAPPAPSRARPNPGP